MTRVERLWQLSRDLLCVANNDGRFSEVNPRFEEVLGWSADELKARPVLDFVHPDDRAATVMELAKLAKGTTTLGFENRFATRDGQWRWLSWTAQPEGGEIFAIARDVTEAKVAEQTRRERDHAQAQALAMAALAEQHRTLLNAVSHEIHSPVTPILMQAEQLERLGHALNEPRLQRPVRALRRSARRLESTVSALLEIGRLTDHPDEFHPSAAGLRTTLAAAAGPFNVDLSEVPDEGIFADGRLLRAAFDALLRNAATHGGGITKVRGSIKDVVRIEIEDKGPGFEGLAGEMWFTPMFRGPSAKVSGHGLGLTVVRLVAASHGGDAGITSAGPGKGCIAWIELPTEY